MSVRTLLALFALGFAAASTAPAAPPPGPPWPTNRPQWGTRSAAEAPEKSFAVAEVSESAGGLVVVVSARAAVAKPKMGQEYELTYQLRVHTKKGEVGPLLGTKQFPKGVSQRVCTVKCEHDWIELYETFDVTRKDLSGMTNLPGTEKGGTVFIRVEPHLFDVSANAYLTPVRTPAAVLVASVAPGGRVLELRPVGEWLAGWNGSAADAKSALARLADLDEYDPTFNRIESAFARVLASETANAGAKAEFVRAVDAKRLNWKSFWEVRKALEALAAGPDGELKAAARAKLDEAK
jgi:hypothetical protein